MSQYPVMKKPVQVGKVLNFTDSKQKYKVIACDGIHYGDKGYTLECVCIDSPIKAMIGEKYSFDDRVFRDYNENNIVIEDVEPVFGLKEAVNQIDQSDVMDKEIKRALSNHVDYDINTGNHGDEELIDASYYDDDQDYTIIGTSDYKEGALDELIYNMKNDPRFDLDRFLKSNSKKPLYEAVEEVRSMDQNSSGPKFG